MIRGGVGTVAIILIWVCALAWALGLDWHTPFSTAERIVLAPGDFQLVSGAGAAASGELRISAAGEDGSAFETVRIGARAEDFAILRYAFDEFPRTLELSLLFRRDDAPEEMQTITIPWPGDGERAVDLRRFPAWHGRIVEIGFAQFATAQLVPGSAGFRPFRLRHAELAAVSWTGALLALRSERFGYTPWALAAINFLGGESTGQPRLAGAAIAGLALTLGIVAVWLRTTWRRLRGLVIAGFVASWLLFDVFWLQGFAAKHSLTETLYAQKSTEERAHLAPDEDLAFIANRTRAWLAAQPRGQRILVAADTAYEYFRLMYLLLPYNAAAMFYVGEAPLRRGDAVLLYGQDKQWKYYPEMGVLNGRDVSHTVEPAISDEGVRIFRVTSADP